MQKNSVYYVRPIGQNPTVLPVGNHAFNPFFWMTLELTRGMCIDLWTVVKYQSQQNIFEISNLGSTYIRISSRAGFLLNNGAELPHEPQSTIKNLRPPQKVNLLSRNL